MDLAGAECSSLSDWSEIGHAEFKHFDLINIFKSTRDLANEILHLFKHLSLEKKYST